MSDDDSSSGVGGDSSVGKPAGANSQIEVYGRLRPSPKNDKTVCVFGEGQGEKREREGSSGRETGREC
jgi:hypothetical protein